ncbi:SMI1/KNR4 family protein, partial [Bacillus anthracis]
PPVIFIDNEFEEIIELAPNFESFLQNLTTYEYDEE